MSVPATPPAGRGTAPDLDATRVLAVSDPDATRVLAASDPDATRVLPDPDATRRLAAADPDATRIRPTAPAFDRAPTHVTRLTRRAGGDTTRPLLDDAAPPPELPPAVAARQPPLALQAGFRLHEYRIERVLGQGGFGITYLATDVNLRAPVAVKEYLPAEIAFRASDRSVAPNASRHRDRYRMGLEMFLAEARTLATFRHPNIVRVARFFEAHRTAYMVLEYERGLPLRSWWPEHQQLGERGLVERWLPLLDGLAVVHAAGFLHRDIKPDNIQVRDDDGRFVLLDFGSAAQTVTLGDQDAVVVTPGFAPIEQYGVGEQGPWTDIHALGATLYWAVCGRKPPDAEARAAGAPMPAAAEVGRGRYGEAFLRAIDWALAARPDERPRDIAAWRAALCADHVSTLSLSDVLGRDAGDAARAAGRTAAWRRLAEPASWPLAVKLTVAMLATALLPMLAAGVYNLETSLQTLAAHQLGAAERLAHGTAGRVGQMLADTLAQAHVVAADADFARWLAAPDAAARPALRERLVRVAQADADIDHVVLLDAGGTARVASDPQLAERSFGDRPYFRAALAGRPFVSSLVVEDAAGAGVYFAVPVADVGGRVLGAVALRIHGASFAAILDEVRAQSAWQPFMVDGDGVVVLHARQELLYRSLTPLPAATLAAIRADRRFGSDAVASLDLPELARAMVGARRPGHVSYVSSLIRDDEITGYAPVPGHAWVVGVSQERAAFEQPFETLYVHLAGSMLLVGLLFTGLALRFARGIVRPIRALTGAADRLKSGDFAGAEVTVRSRDEVGQLARTFNVMVDVLRQRERERGQRSVPPRDGTP